MYQVTVDYAKANLEELCDRTEKEPDGVVIVRENRSYILITQEEWESLAETSELMQDPKLLQHKYLGKINYILASKIVQHFFNVSEEALSVFIGTKFNPFIF
ncbi:hypothetical protein MiTa_01260 [Microcystis aeruginosa NIES-4264]|nr:hypothetical protein MiTa_01260 [Microcystis aeruginosa NIES-4264]